MPNYDALMGLLKQHAGAYGSGVEDTYTMVHKAPQSAKARKSCEESMNGRCRLAVRPDCGDI
jgi:hypothetical protein